MDNKTDNYKSLVESSPLVMIEFFATWCGHCQRMMPVVEQIRELVGTNAAIYQLDIDKNEETANSEGINATPTFIIYRDGRPVWRYSGEIDGNILLQKLQSFMN